MANLGNGYGAIIIEDGVAIGIHRGQEIGRLPIPMTSTDAKMMIALCLTDDGREMPGETAKMFILQNMCGWTFRAGLWYRPTSSRGYTKEQALS